MKCIPLILFDYDNSLWFKILTKQNLLEESVGHRLILLKQTWVKSQ